MSINKTQYFETRKHTDMLKNNIFSKNKNGWETWTRNGRNIEEKNHNVIQTVFKTNTKRLNEKGNKKMKGLWCKK